MPNVISISREIQFDAGHRVPRHESKCRNPHGHRYRVKVSCLGEIIEEVGPDQGMLIDFGHLKTFLTEEVHDPLDHGFIVHEEDVEMLNALGIFRHKTWDDPNGSRVYIKENDWKTVVFPYVPTAENIAVWCWERLEPRIEGHFRNNLRLVEVRVWETPASEVWYNGSDFGP